MSEFKIEKGVPVPPRNNYARYPFKDMEAGDSFHVPAADGETARTVQLRMSAAVVSHRRRHPDTKYVVHQEDGGVRVWRIA